MTEEEVGKALGAAASKGHAPVINFLLREFRVADSRHGPFTLRRAMEGGHLEAVCLLLEAGTPTGDVAAFAQAAQQSVGQFSPEQTDHLLQAATQHGHTQFADMLRELRAAANQDGV
jgi:hypothetical protein